MSQTTGTDGTIRFAPDRGHISSRRIPASQAILLALVVVLLGIASARRLGTAVAVPLVAVTAIVTVAAVILWRATLPRLVDVTVTADAVTYRRHGRRSTLRRDDDLRVTPRMITATQDLTSPYLVVSGTGDDFVLSTDLWAEEDLERMIAELSATAAPGPVEASYREVREQFPGAMPAYLAHPHRTAILAIVVLVPVVVAGMLAVGSLADEDDPAPARRADLSADASRDQRRLHDRAMAVLGDDTTWQADPVRRPECDGPESWQRVLTGQAVDARTVRGREVSALTALAKDAGLPAKTRTLDATTHSLAFVNDETGAFLTVDGSGPVATVRTGSACVMPR